MQNMPPLKWYKSSRSYETGACVEVAQGDSIHVRDSTNPDQTILTIPAHKWVSFVRAI